MTSAPAESRTFRPYRQRFPVLRSIPTSRHASLLLTPWAISCAYRRCFSACTPPAGVRRLVRIATSKNRSVLRRQLASAADDRERLDPARRQQHPAHDIARPSLVDVVSVQDAGNITVAPDVKTAPSWTSWTPTTRGDLTGLIPTFRLSRLGVHRFALCLHWAGNRHQ